MGVRVAQRKLSIVQDAKNAAERIVLTIYMENFEMNTEEIKSKVIALVVHNADKDDDIHIYLGRLLFAGENCFFVNEEKGWKSSLNSEQLNRLKPVPDILKTALLNADYALPMVIQSLPNSDVTGYEKTGMKWHE